jgi:hypothetical protein
VSRGRGCGAEPLRSTGSMTGVTTHRGMSHRVPVADGGLAEEWRHRCAYTVLYVAALNRALVAGVASSSVEIKSQGPSPERCGEGGAARSEARTRAVGPAAGRALEDVEKVLTDRWARWVGKMGDLLSDSD